MIGESLIKDISQVRLDELSGKHIHLRRLRMPVRWNRFVEVLTFAVPILYTAPKLLWTEAAQTKTITAIDVVISVVLLAAAVTLKVLHWDGEIQERRSAVAKNQRVANQALEIVTDKDATDEAARWFLRLAKEPDMAEQRLLENVSKREKQEAYREALKEFSPATREADCLFCGASAWQFKPGSCQTCGGTPASRMKG